MSDPAAAEDALLWIELKPELGEQPAKFPAGRIASVHSRLAPFCEGLTEEMTKDLLDRDLLPDVKKYGRGAQIRLVATFAVVAPAREQMWTVQNLLLDPVTFLAGEGWLLSCWHEPKTEQHLAERRAQLRDRVRRDVAQHWEQGGGESIGDLGVLALRELAIRYSVPRERLHDWLGGRETGFYRRIQNHDTFRIDSSDFPALATLAGTVTEFQRRLAALNVPWRRADTGWFLGLTDGEAAKEIDEMIDRARRDLDGLAGSIRSCFALMQSFTAAQQLRLSQEQEGRSQSFQRAIEVAVALVAVPALIAAVYGANTALPERGTWAGFALLLGTMILAAAASFAGLVVYHRRHGGRTSPARDSLPAADAAARGLPPPTPQPRLEPIDATHEALSQ